jgi:hypothetical protein
MKVLLGKVDSRNEKSGQGGKEKIHCHLSISNSRAVQENSAQVNTTTN